MFKYKCVCRLEIGKDFFNYWRVFNLVISCYSDCYVLGLEVDFRSFDFFSNVNVVIFVEFGGFLIVEVFLLFVYISYCVRFWGFCFGLL